MREAGRADGYVLQLSPPPRLFERLAQIPGFTWDQTIRPFHSVSDGHWRFRPHVLQSCKVTKVFVRRTTIGISLAHNMSDRVDRAPLPFAKGATLQGLYPQGMITGQVICNSGTGSNTFEQMNFPPHLRKAVYSSDVWLRVSHLMSYGLKESITCAKHSCKQLIQTASIYRD